MDTDDWSYTEQQLFHSHFPLIKMPSSELPGSFDAFFFFSKVKKKERKERVCKVGLNDAMLSCSCSEKKGGWVEKEDEESLVNLDKGRREP